MEQFILIIKLFSGYDNIQNQYILIFLVGMSWKHCWKKKKKKVLITGMTSVEC